MTFTANDLLILLIWTVVFMITIFDKRYMRESIFIFSVTVAIIFMPKLLGRG